MKGKLKATRRSIRAARATPLISYADSDVVNKFRERPHAEPSDANGIDEGIY